MIVVHIQTKVKPENRAVFLQQAQQDAEMARGFEGCLKMLWSEDVEDPNSFTLYEEWETPSAFDAFKSSPAFEASGKVLFPLFAAPPKTAYYTASPA